MAHGLMAGLVIVLIIGADGVVRNIERDFRALNDETYIVLGLLGDQRFAGLRIISSTYEYLLAATSSAEPAQIAARKQVELALLNQGTEQYREAPRKLFLFYRDGFPR